MINTGDRKQRAFTLVEMMITLGLVALVYTMISTILLQIARFSKSGREVAESRYELLTEVEIMRYQLRGMAYPNGIVALSGKRSGVKGRDTLVFLTTSGRKLKGIVEVGYKIEESIDPETSEAVTALYYREFPFRRTELRQLADQQEGPWEMVLSDVGSLNLEYSTDGSNWQKEWTEESAPRSVRVSLKRAKSPHDKIAFEVTPGVSSNRW